MTTYRVDLSYDGSGFHGFARQTDDIRTVQGVLESALERVFREPIELVVAGRTDTGVHARQQVVSFSSTRTVDARRIARAVTSMLGPEVVALSAAEVEDGFSARFDAEWRAYRYRILNRPAPDPLRRHTVWHVERPLDVERMHVAAQGFVGSHDFASFCRRRPCAGTERTVYEAVVRRHDDLVVFSVRAKAFCHQMVRSMTGYLVDVGSGRRSPEGVADVLDARDRSVTPGPAPPTGLVLWEVSYPATPDPEER